MDFDIADMIASQMPISDTEAADLRRLIPIRTYGKGTVLLRPGQISSESFFNLQGCIRLYYLNEGEERTTFFYTEGQAVSSLTSYLGRIPADHYLECVEDCALAVFSYEHEKELYRLHPKFESLCRVSMEEEFGKHQQILASYITQSPEQRYLNLLQTRPELLNRVPQYLLASYLGVKPESLSRIRKRVAEKG